VAKAFQGRLAFHGETLRSCCDAPASLVVQADSEPEPLGKFASGRGSVGWCRAWRLDFDMLVVHG
jgi:hypothetical protein